MLEVAGQRVWFGTSEDLSFLPGGSVDLVLTSPPYWNRKRYGAAGEIGHEPYDTYLARLDTVWAECHRAARPGAVLVVNVAHFRHQRRYYPLAFDIAERMKGWVLWDVLIWYVPNALPQPNHYRDRLFDAKHEYLLVFTRDGDLDYRFDQPRVPQKYRGADPRADKMDERGRSLGSVIRIPAYRPPNIRELGHHIAAYPEELAALVIRTFSEPSDVVLDPFLGSGTTLKVTRSLRRNGIGVELNPDFEPLIRRRIAEPFEEPDWTRVDVLHSATNTPGSGPTRRSDLRGRGRHG